MRTGAVAALFACAVLSPAQKPQGSSPTDGFDGHTTAYLMERAHQMRTQAWKSPSGVASATLESYPGHSTMLTVRTASGGAESHQHFNDIFVILEGEGTEVVGGTIEGAHEVSAGETRGSRVLNGESHRLQKGDIVHISPGVPHQLLVAPGNTFIYYVIKIEQD